MIRCADFLQYVKLSATMLTVAIALLLQLRFNNQVGSPVDSAHDPITFPLGIAFMVCALLVMLQSTHEFFALSSSMKRHLGFVSSSRMSLFFWVVMVCLILTGTILILVRGKLPP
jgi:hypothetical protein